MFSHFERNISYMQATGREFLSAVYAWAWSARQRKSNFRKKKFSKGAQNVIVDAFSD